MNGRKSGSTSNTTATLPDQGLSKELEKVHSEVLVCTKCPLHESRTIAVPGEGPIGAKVMFVGEAPGQQEDLVGRPFVGAAGRLLNKLLESISLDRMDVFITNIVKCRPPKNRPPRKGETTACNPYLQAQIGLVNPRILVALGTPAIKTIMGEDYSVGRVHGRLFRTPTGLMVFPSYHPAAALYHDNIEVRETLYQDFQSLKKFLDGEIDWGSAEPIVVPPVKKKKRANTG